MWRPNTNNDLNSFIIRVEAMLRHLSRSHCHNCHWLTRTSTCPNPSTITTFWKKHWITPRTPWNASSVDKNGSRTALDPWSFPERPSTGCHFLQKYHPCGSTLTPSSHWHHLLTSPWLLCTSISTVQELLLAPWVLSDDLLLPRQADFDLLSVERTVVSSLAS